MEKERISVHGTVSHASHAFRLHEQQGSTSEVNPTLQWEHSGSTVGAPQQSDQEPSIFLWSGVIHTPFFPQSLILRRLSVIIDYFSAHRISRPVCAGVSRKHEKDKHSGLTVPLGRLYEKVWNRWARSKA